MRSVLLTIHTDADGEDRILPAMVRHSAAEAIEKEQPAEFCASVINWQRTRDNYISVNDQRTAGLLRIGRQEFDVEFTAHVADVISDATRHRGQFSAKIAIHTVTRRGPIGTIR